MKTKKRTIVSAVLVSKDEKILLGKVRDGGVYPDCWHIPGGGVDGDETKQQALIREIKEEVGIDISGIDPFLLSDTDTGVAKKVDKDDGETYQIEMTFNTYRVDLSSNADDVVVSLDDDLKEYKWASFDELKNYKHTPPSQKLFNKLGWLK